MLQQQLDRKRNDGSHAGGQDARRTPKTGISAASAVAGHEEVFVRKANSPELENALNQAMKALEALAAKKQSGEAASERNADGSGSC